MTELIDPRTLFLAVVFVSAFGSVFFLLLWAQESRRLKSIGYAAAKAEQIEEEFIREARGDLLTGASRKLRRAGYTGDPAPVLAGLGFLVLSLSALLSLAGVDDPAALLASLMLTPAIGFLAIQYAVSRRRQKGARQMLTLMRAALLHLESGSSPPQALSRAAEQAGSPLREDMLRAIASKVGSVTLSEALEPIAEQYPSEAADLLIAAIGINDQLGAPLSPALQQAEAILTERQDLAAEATAELSSARSEFIGITVAITAIAFMLGRQPAAVAAYTTPLGLLVVVAGVTNYLIGVVRAVRMFRSAKG